MGMGAAQLRIFLLQLIDLRGLGVQTLLLIDLVLLLINDVQGEFLDLGKELCLHGTDVNAMSSNLRGRRHTGQVLLLPDRAFNLAQRW